MKKGFVITMELLAGIIILMVFVLIVFLVWASFKSEAGPLSGNIFFTLLDFIGSLLS